MSKGNNEIITIDSSDDDVIIAPSSTAKAAPHNTKKIATHQHLLASPGNDDDIKIGNSSEESKYTFKSKSNRKIHQKDDFVDLIHAADYAKASSDSSGVEGYATAMSPQDAISFISNHKNDVASPFQRRANNRGVQRRNADEIVILNDSSNEDDDRKMPAKKRKKDDEDLVIMLKDDNEVVEIFDMTNPSSGSHTNIKHNNFITGAEKNKAKVILIDDCDLKPASHKRRRPETLDNLPPNASVLQRILDVIPDCDEQHAGSVCTKFGVHFTQIVGDGEARNVQKIVSYLLEHGYEKDRSNKNKRRIAVPLHLQEDIEANSNAAAAIGAVGQTYSQDFESTSWELSPKYMSEVLAVLMNMFPIFSKDGMIKLLSTSQHHLAPCVQKICDAIVEGKKNEAGKNAPEFGPEVVAEMISGAMSGSTALSSSQVKLLNEKAQNFSGRSIVLKKARRSKLPVIVTDELLQEEIQFVTEKQREAMEIADHMKARLKAREEAEASNSLVECGCCYCEYAQMEMVTCAGGGRHLFCVDCLKRYAQEQLFGMQKTTLKCMHQGSGNDACRGEFSYRELERSLPKKVLQKYNEASFDAAMKAAGLNNIVKCPKCEFQAELPESEMIFRCPAAGCHFESCRYCGEEPHMPLKCSEVEKKSETQSRRKIEEAMTAARVRECPDCGNRFYKTEGCNKMSCKCGTKLCYICRKKINTYTHFCQKFNCDHKTCGKCSLYTNSIEDDRLAVKEAGELAAQQISSANSDGTKPNVDVNALLEDEPANNRNQAARIIPPVRLDNVHNRHARLVHQLGFAQHGLARVAAELQEQNQEVAFEVMRRRIEGQQAFEVMRRRIERQQEDARIRMQAGIRERANNNARREARRRERDAARLAVPFHEPEPERANNNGRREVRRREIDAARMRGRDAARVARRTARNQIPQAARVPQFVQVPALDLRRQAERDAFQRIQLAVEQQQQQQQQQRRRRR